MYMAEGHVAVTRIHTLSHDCSHLIGLPRFRVIKPHADVALYSITGVKFQLCYCSDPE